MTPRERARWLQWGRGDRRRIPTRDFPPAVLALVDERQGGRRCVLCAEQGLTTPPEVPLEIDHLQPLSRGGDNHHLNLRWLCRWHNRARGDRRRVTHGLIPPWARSSL